MPKKSELFLENKRKKVWVDKMTGHNAIMLYARALDVTWGRQSHWDWNCFKELREEKIEVAKLSHICWLDVRGKLKLSDFSPSTTYEIAYMIKLTKNASGWELPITLRLQRTNAPTVERQVSILDSPRKEWIELKLGTFFSGNGVEDGEVWFDLMEHGGHWKIGLLVQGAVIRPLD